MQQQASYEERFETKIAESKINGDSGFMANPSRSRKRSRSILGLLHSSPFLLCFGFVTNSVDNMRVFGLLLSNTCTMSRLSLFPSGSRLWVDKTVEGDSVWEVVSALTSFGFFFFPSLIKPSSSLPTSLLTSVLPVPQEGQGLREAEGLGEVKPP